MKSPLVPCIYFHGQMQADLSLLQQAELRESLTEMVSKQFSSFFGTNIFVNVQIEQGSLIARVWLPITYVSVILSVFVNIPKVPSSFRQYVKAAQTHVIPFIADEFKHYGLNRIVSQQARTGLIGKLDRVIHRHKANLISDDEYMKQAIGIFNEINKSPDRGNIIKDLVKYLDEVDPDFPWDYLRDQIYNDTAIIPKNEEFNLKKNKKLRKKSK